MAKEKKSKMRQQIDDLCEENEYYSMKQTRNRARSITVGTAFGGVVEVNMRSDAGSVYAQMQPIEAIELIEQIAAGVGVDIAMRPKQNFASWRGWENPDPHQHILWKGTTEPWRISASEETEETEERETKEQEKVNVEEIEPLEKEEEEPTKKLKTRRNKKETEDE